MNIQPNNQNANNSINFQRLIVKKGSFNALKQAQYFPEKSYPNFNENMRNFYKKLKDLKNSCADNTTYDVIINCGKKIDDENSGVYIQDAAGIIQCGFKESFKDLFRLRSMEPKRILTEEDEPRLLTRLIKNWNIKRENIKLSNKKVDMSEFLDSVYKNIKAMVNNANYLTQLSKIKKTGDSKIC